MREDGFQETLGMSLDSQERLKAASRQLTTLEVPGYRLERELGQGSFGTVWEAERNQTGQRVAIKLVLREQSLNWDYFKRELDFLRDLEDHPYTLTVLDADLNHQPPYIVTPLVEGGSLEKNERPTVETAEIWIEQMAEALVYIHSKGVIHCDLKPSNIYLSTTGSIRVGDLGQGRTVAGDEVSWGTIGFMAPEQCVDPSRKVSPSVQWDVYGFGATAYWLLTGLRPRLEEADHERMSAVDGVEDRLRLYRQCLEQNSLVPIRELNPMVDRELAALIEACLEVDPSRRVETMNDVVDDLEKRARGEPLLCRRPWSLAYLLRVALARFEVQLLMVGLLLLVAGGYYFWTDSQRRQFRFHVESGLQAEESGQPEEAYLHWLESLRFDTDRSSLGRLAFMPIERTYPHQDVVNSLAYGDQGRLLATASSDQTAAVWRANTGEKLATLRHGDRVQQVLFTPDQKLLTASWDGAARLFDWRSGRMVHSYSHDQGQEIVPSVISMALASDGSWLVTADSDGHLKLWQVESGREQELVPSPEADFVVQKLAFHPDNHRFAALWSYRSLRLWEVTTGEPTGPVMSHDEEINDLAFSPDGSVLASASDDRRVKLWDASTGRLVRRLPPHQARVNAVGFSPDGTQLAAAGDDGTVEVWDLTSPSETPVGYLPHRRPVRSLAFSQDGSLLAAGTGEKQSLWSTSEPNGTVQVWSLDSYQPVTATWPHDGQVHQVQFHPDQPLVAAASGGGRRLSSTYNGMARSWRVVLATPGQWPSEVVRGPELSLTNDGTAVLLPDGTPLSHGKKVAINSVVVDPSARFVATGSADRTTRVWSFQDGSPIGRPIPQEGSVEALAFGPGGTWLATAASDRSTVIRIWESATGIPITPHLYAPKRVEQLAFSEDGHQLALRTPSGKVFSYAIPELERLSPEVEQRLRAQLDSSGTVVSQ